MRKLLVAFACLLVTACNAEAKYQGQCPVLTEANVRQPAQNEQDEFEYAAVTKCTLQDITPEKVGPLGRNMVQVCIAPDGTKLLGRDDDCQLFSYDKP